MKNLQEATERICELKGNIVALDAVCSALLQHLPASSREQFRRTFEGWAELARTWMLNTAISEHSIASFELDVARIVALIDTLQRQEGSVAAPAPAPPRPGPRGRDVVESLLLAVPRVSTFQGARALTGASGFFFERDERLYLVTSRHVLVDEPSRHFPDRLEIVVHTDDADLSRTSVVSMRLYEEGRAAWHQGLDSGGEIDVAVLRIGPELLDGFRPHAFTPRHLQQPPGDVEIGTPLLVVGFPLGFEDGRHQLPVARQAAVASSFGTPFRGQGMFLTDALTHRGTSGAPVVMRAGPAARHDLGPLPWKLLGVHASRMDLGGHDLDADESPGLGCAWYADILLALTER